MTDPPRIAEPAAVSATDAATRHVRAALGTTPVDVVTVHVRRGGDEDSRRISFRIPEGLPPEDLLDAGFAIDGSEAILDLIRDAEDPDAPGGARIFAYHTFADARGGDPPDGGINYARTLSAALRATQLGLIKVLKRRGYTVRFA